jgi:hypothetical protein
VRGLSLSVIATIILANRVALHYAPFAMSEIAGGGLVAAWLLLRDRSSDDTSWKARRQEARPCCRRHGWRNSAAHLPGIAVLGLIALLRPQIVLLPLAVAAIDAARRRDWEVLLRDAIAAGFLYLLGTTLFFALLLETGLFGGLRRLVGFLELYFQRLSVWESIPWWAQFLHLGIMISPPGLLIIAWRLSRLGRVLVKRRRDTLRTVRGLVARPDFAILGGGIVYLLLHAFVVPAAEARYLLVLWPIVAWILARAYASFLRRRPVLALLALLASLLFALPGLTDFHDAFYRTPLAQSLSETIVAKADDHHVVLARPTAALHPGRDRILTRFDASYHTFDWGRPAFAFHARRPAHFLPPSVTSRDTGFPVPNRLTGIVAPMDLLVVPDPFIHTTTTLPARMSPVHLVQWRPETATASITIETAVWDPQALLDEARQRPSPDRAFFGYLLDLGRPLLVAIVALIVAAGIGRIISDRLGGDGHPCREILLGFLGLGAWYFLAGSLLGLSPLVLHLPLLGLLLFRPDRWRAAFRTTRNLSTEDDPASPWTTRIGIAGVIVAILAASAPPLGMDALTYHLGLPDQYQLRGSTVPVATNAYHLYWQQAEMAFIPLVRFDPSGRGVGLFIAALWIVGLAGLAALARRLGGSPGLALLVGATSPLAIELVALTKPDLIVLALLAWGARSLLDRTNGAAAGGQAVPSAFCDILSLPRTLAPARPPAPGMALFGGARRIAALLLGGAIAVKPSAGLIALPLWLVFLGRDRTNQDGTAGQGDSPSRPYVETALLAALPILWIGRNLLASGRALPGGYEVTLLDAARGPLEALLHLARAAVVHLRDGTDGPYGPLLLLAFIAAIMRLRQAGSLERRLVAAGIIGALLWLVAGKGQARLFLPIFIAWIPSLAIAWRSLRITAKSLILLLAVISLATGLLILEEEHAPIRLAIGAIAPEHHATAWLDSHGLQEKANRLLPPEAAIFAIGEAELFPLHRRAEYDGYWEPSRVLAWAHEAHDPAEVLARLRVEGFTHVLYNPGLLERLAARGLMPAPPCGRDQAVVDEAIMSLPPVVVDLERGIEIRSLISEPGP